MAYSGVVNSDARKILLGAQKWSDALDDLQMKRRRRDRGDDGLRENDGSLSARLIRVCLLAFRERMLGCDHPLALTRHPELVPAPGEVFANTR